LPLLLTIPEIWLVRLGGRFAEKACFSQWQACIRIPVVFLSKKQKRQL